MRRADGSEHEDHKGHKVHKDKLVLFFGIFVIFVIFDAANWDRSLVSNVPGQSGQPGSPYYGNLLKMWADNEYFPLAFSKTAVNAAALHRLTLRP